MIKLNQKALLQSLDLEKQQKMTMKNSVFGKTMEPVWKHKLKLRQKHKLITIENLFGVRTKLSYYKVLQGKFIGYRTAKTSNTYE